VVERVDDESANQASSEEDNGVDETDNPLILRAFADAEFLRERKVGTVGTGLDASVFTG